MRYRVAAALSILVLPVVATACPPAPPATVCWEGSGPGSGSFDVKFSGTYDVVHNSAILYKDSAGPCLGEVLQQITVLVASSRTEAEAKCDALVPYPVQVVVPLNNVGYAEAPPNAYFCP